MGLCRCPHRKVSTLFCFKHHVNVCEHCLVNDHSQCIVRSYILWLEDNDYDPNCSLCHQSLSDTNQETIRLMCYDVFHWSCLNEYFRSFPSTTAPDGYICPRAKCETCIFPPGNLVSPVADEIRKKLSTESWATRFQDTSNLQRDKQQPLVETENNGYVIVNSTTTNETNRLTYNPHRTIDMTQGSTNNLNENDTEEEDKYKRRSVFTWFARWLRSRQTTNRKTSTISRTQMSRTRYTIYMILIILFIFITILTVLYHLTRSDDDEYFNRNDNSQFNPFRNPFIRVGGQLIKDKLADQQMPNNRLE